MASFAGPLLESIEFVRQYSGPPLPEGAKSVSFRLTVGSPERTLSSEEVGEIRAAHHRRHARTGLRTARVSTRRAKPGGWVPRRQKGLCRWCGAAVPKGRFTFCGDACVHEWKLRTDPGYLREQVFARDRGVCALCGVDTEALRRDKRKLDYAARRQFEKEMGRPAPPVGRRPHRAGGRRRRRVRLVQHADAVPEVPQGRDGGVTAEAEGRRYPGCIFSLKRV